MKIYKLMAIAFVLMALLCNCSNDSDRAVSPAQAADPTDPADADPGVHSVTGLPLTEDGWTDFAALIQGDAAAAAQAGAYDDARVVFVSSSDGDDATGQIYSILDITFDENGMFQPQGPVNAFATLAEAYTNVRSGYPDILLLKRGDEWAERQTFNSELKSGRSITERSIVATYGTGDRPKLYNLYINGRLAQFTIVAGLHSWFDDWLEDNTARFINITNETSKHQLYEDLYSDRQYSNKIQSGADGFIENIVIRRCVFKDYAAWDGIFYTWKVRDFLFEENIFYKPRRARLDDDDELYVAHGRHFYLAPFDSQTDTITIRRNIFYGGERESIDIRSGGIMDNNLSLKNDLTTIGGRGGSADKIQSAQVVNNVFLEGTPNTSDGNTLNLINIDGGIVRGNIWTDEIDLGIGINTINIVGFEDVHIAKNIDISENIVYGFSGAGAARALTVSSDLQEVENLTIDSNEFQYVNGSAEIILHREWQADRFAGFTYSDNRYYSTAAESGWFTPGGTLAGWIAESGETGAQAGLITSYSDPDRTIRTYNQALGGGADTEEFMLEALKQSRHNWRSEYTACGVNNYIRAGFDKDPVECAF